MEILFYWRFNFKLRSKNRIDGDFNDISVTQDGRGSVGRDRDNRDDHSRSTGKSNWSQMWLNRVVLLLLDETWLMDSHQGHTQVTKRCKERINCRVWLCLLKISRSYELYLMNGGLRKKRKMPLTLPLTQLVMRWIPLQGSTQSVWDN